MSDSKKEETMKVQVLKNFKTTEGVCHRRYLKDKSGLFVVDKNGIKQPNFIDCLKPAELKAALKMKAVEVV